MNDSQITLTIALSVFTLIVISLLVMNSP